MRAATGAFDAEGRKIERRQAQLRKRLESSWSGFGRTIIPSLGAIGAALSVREVIEYADKWTGAKNALRVAGVEGDNLTSVLDGLFKSAQKNGVALNPLVGVYSKIAQVQGELGASAADVTKFTDGVALSLKVAGTSAGAASGALLQLGQLLGGQKVQAQEYNSILDGAFPLLQAVAEGSDRWGGSVARLTADVKAGNVTVQDFFRSALAGFPALEKRAVTAQTSISQAMQKLENAFEKYVGETAAAGGATSAITGAIDTLSDHLDEVVKAALVLASVLGPGMLVRSIMGSVTALGALSGLILANPLGALAAVAVAAGAALVLFGRSSSEAAKAILEEKSAHEQLNALLGEASSKTKEVSKAKYDEAKAHLESARATLKEAEAQAELNLQKAKTQDNPKALPNFYGGFSGQSPTGNTQIAQGELDRVRAAIQRNAAALAALGTLKPVADKPAKPVAPPAKPPAALSLSGIQDVVSTPRIGTDEVKKILSDGDKMIAQIKTEGDVIGMTSAQAEAYRWKVQALADISREYGGVTEEQAAQVDATAAALLRAGEATDHLRAMLEAYLQHQEDIARENEYVARGLGDVAVAGLRGFGSLKDAAADFLGSLAEMILRVQVLDPLLKNLGGGSGGIFNSILGAFGAADLGSTVSASIAANPLLFKNGGIARNGRSVSLPMMADGGVSRRPAIISEYGQPEAAVPLPDGRRIPVDLRMPAVPSITPSAASAPVIVQHFDLSGAVVTDEIMARAQAAGENAATTRLQQFNSHVLPGRVRQLVADPYRGY
jgi:tape measure domain-containing protein